MPSNNTRRMSKRLRNMSPERTPKRSRVTSGRDQEPNRREPLRWSLRRRRVHQTVSDGPSTSSSDENPRRQARKRKLEEEISRDEPKRKRITIDVQTREVGKKTTSKLDNQKIGTLSEEPLDEKDNVHQDPKTKQISNDNQTKEVAEKTTSKLNNQKKRALSEESMDEKDNLHQDPKRKQISNDKQTKEVAKKTTSKLDKTTKETPCEETKGEKDEVHQDPKSNEITSDKQTKESDKKTTSKYLFPTKEATSEETMCEENEVIKEPKTNAQSPTEKDKGEIEEEESTSGNTPKNDALPSSEDTQMADPPISDDADTSKSSEEKAKDRATQRSPCMGGCDVGETDDWKHGNHLMIIPNERNEESRAPGRMLTGVGLSDWESLPMEPLQESDEWTEERLIELLENAAGAPPFPSSIEEFDLDELEKLLDLCDASNPE